jgi:translation initiation factor 3 subunit G
MVGKWADADDDDTPVSPLAKSNIIVSGPDAQGVKTIVEYTERKGVNYKTTRKVKETVVKKRVSRLAEARKDLPKFLETNKLENVELMRAVGEEVKIEPRRVERKEDNLDPILGVDKPKSVWTKFRGPGAVPLADTGRDEGKPEDKPADEAPARDGEPGKYVPPSLRSGTSLADLRMQEQKDRDALTLRVTNLSEDVREGDLSELFGQFGRIQRIFLAKNAETKQSKGFAFITFSSKPDAELAIKRLNGHGYDNLVLRVEFSKPQNRDDAPGGGDKGGKGESGKGEGKGYGGSFAEQMRSGAFR